MTVIARAAGMPATRTLFVLLLAGSFFVSPALSLFAGILMALTLGNPFPAWSKKVSKHMLQYFVVGLGFGMNFHESLAAGREGMTLSLIHI